ncbi:triacylglycerol lipase OBL1-like [Gossypium hirsutum]|uniref:Triacylglycerol lipase OBL1-like n=1 Tax=Gossypium hirsutum TaxID=3635 RepID=A0A1U8IBK3_GOSHI|nr:triacylglycerol lipase OBL1-like [Gossypium hirsutum]
MMMLDVTFSGEGGNGFSMVKELSSTSCEWRMKVGGREVIIPKRGTKTFISTIGQLDERVELYKVTERIVNLELDDRAIMDLCMMASKLAYENAQVVKNVVVHHWKMHFVDFYNGWDDYQKENSTQVFMICDKPKDATLILISFRGTEPFNANNWNTDIDYSWYEIPKVGKLHMGFLEALGLGNREDIKTFRYHLQTEIVKKSDDGIGKINIRSLDMTAYHMVREKLRSLLEEHKNAKFIVTGHSLGGALAILFPIVLVIHEEKKLMERLLAVYTFGQPMVGNQQLGKFMEAHLDHPVPKYFRVVYCNDLVPRLPYDDKTFLYKHFGVCLYYNSCYIEQLMGLFGVINNGFFMENARLVLHLQGWMYLILVLVTISMIEGVTWKLLLNRKVVYLMKNRMEKRQSSTRYLMI